MYELKLPGTPPSMNRVGGQSDWRKFHREKKKWEGYCMIALLEAKVPKGLSNMRGHVKVTAELHFKTKRRRDEGNFRMILEKALGDALQLGWIEDDTPEFYSFGEVTFAEETTSHPMTLVRLEVTSPRV